MIKENFQRMAVEQGDAFHLECIRSLRMVGFEVVDQRFTIDEVGIELDAITNNAHGIAMPWEFKGSWNGDRPGLWRTDTLKKAIANGYLLSRWSEACRFTPLLVMTSHLPQHATGSVAAMFRTVERRIILDVVDSRNARSLRWLYNADERALRRHIDGE